MPFTACRSAAKHARRMAAAWKRNIRFSVLRDHMDNLKFFLIESIRAFG